MAKAKPSLTLMEMESKLGYKVDSWTYPDESSERFYSDLRPIPNSIYGKTIEEFEEYERKMYRKAGRTVSEKVLLELDVVKTIAHGEDTVTVTRRNHIVFYNSTVDIHYGCGFDLPLLFSSDEAFRLLSVAKLQPNTLYSVTPMFFRLPREIRDKIYTFALPTGKWQVGDVDNCDGLNFTGSIGDPSGFYFPLSSQLSVLRVDRQIRQEALPLAYRRTVFHLDDMDDLIKLLIAVGKIGRDNIESLELTWESRADSELKWDKASDSDDLFLTLPTLHAAKCVQLLKQCKRLQFLRLYFESDLISNISPDAFKTDPGIRGLCSVRGIKRVQIWDLGYEPVEQHGLAKWLKGELESHGEQGENEKGISKRDCNQ